MPTPRPTPVLAPTDMPAAFLPAPHTELVRGRYQGDAGLQVIFRVDDGWTYEQAAPLFFDIEQDVGSPYVIAVQFAGLGDIARGAQDVAAEIEGQSDLNVSARSDVELDCHLGAIRLTVEPKDTSPETPQFWPVVNVAAGQLSVASGRRLQLDVFNFHMGTAIIMVGGSIARWDETLAAAQPVLDSVQLRPSGGAACD